jgi:hypothetical protein
MQWIRAANLVVEEYELTGLAAVSSRIIMGGFMIVMWPFLLVGLVLFIPFKVAMGCLPCLIMLPMLLLNVVHLVLLAPLLGTSHLWSRAPLLRPVLMIVSIPIAVVDAAYLLVMLGMLENPGGIIEAPLSWPATAKAFRGVPSITTDQSEF